MKEELYSKRLSKDEYFVLWARKNNFNLTEDIKDRIYSKYLVKFEVFHRDNFTCQNIHCLKHSDLMTVHHIKAQRNGGEDKPRNLVTLCDRCHKDYERAKKPLTFNNSHTLPPHVRGKTFKLFRDRTSEEWKALKKQMKRYRKTVRDQGGNISWEQVYQLLRCMGWI
jgi:hypothetical protein